MRRTRARLGAGLLVALTFWGPGPARGENLQDAWSIALRVNDELLARQNDSRAAALNVASARSARLPSVKNQTFNALIAPAPGFSVAGMSGAGSAGTGLGATTGLGSLAGGQNDIPISNTSVSLPLYTGGRLKHNVAAASAQLGSQRAEEFREALDLKLTVAEAYVGVLLADKNLKVADSNVKRLSAFLKDVENRKKEGLASLNDRLSAEVSLSRARQDQNIARKNLSVAWARYNRYLGRPLTCTPGLAELSVPAAGGEIADLTSMALRARPELAHASESEIQALTAEALRLRPELLSLSEQARALGEQAEANRAATRPTVSINAGYTYVGLNALSNQNLLTSLLSVNWTLADSGATRRKTESLREQQRATVHRRANTAADIALEVRSAWLDLAEARRRIPLTRDAIAQAEENIKVLVDRYREGLSSYTQVLDAESLRIQTYTNYYAALYDAVLAAFRLKRAAGAL